MLNQENEDLASERFPSGQRGQTVNLLAMPSEVRILPSPPGQPSVDWLNHSAVILCTPSDFSKTGGMNCSIWFGHGEANKLNNNETVFGPSGVKKGFRGWLSFLWKGGSSSVGRASAFQAEGRGFDPRFPLHFLKDILSIPRLTYSGSLSHCVDRFFLCLRPT